MFNLIYKDIFINKKSTANLLFSLMLNIVAIIVFNYFIGSYVYIAIPCIFAITLILSCCGAGEKNDVDILFNSLPTSRRELVLSKYLSTFIFFLAGSMLTAIVILVKSLLGYGEIKYFVDFISISISLVFTSLYISLYFPIYFYFGYLKSQAVSKFISFIVFIGIIVAIMIRIIIKQGMENKVLNKLSGIMNFRVIIISIVFSILITMVSSIISLRIYSNREL